MFLILIGIVIAQRAGFLVGSAAKGWIPNDAITTMLGFSMIKFLPMILSLSLFLAVLLTMSRWHRDSEMAIWLSSGLALSKWIRPILNIAMPVIIAIALLSFYLTPWASQKIEEYRVQLKSRDEVAAISPGVFKESNDGQRVYFVEGFDELGNVVKNVFIQSIQHQKSGVIVANKGRRYQAENDDNFVVLEQGRRYEGKPNSAAISTTEFESYSIRMESREEGAKRPAKIGTLTTRTLLDSESPRAKAELQGRLAIPISALILVLLAIPLSFVDPRAGRSLNMMFAIAIFVIYNNMLNIFDAWIKQDKISTVVGLWPVHIIFALLAYYLFYRRSYILPILPIVFQRFWHNNLAKIKKYALKIGPKF